MKKRKLEDYKKEAEFPITRARLTRDMEDSYQSEDDGRNAIDIIQDELLEAIEFKDLQAVKDDIEIAYLEGLKLDTEILQQALDLNEDEIARCIVTYCNNIHDLTTQSISIKKILNIGLEAERLCCGEEINIETFNDESLKLFKSRIELNIDDNYEYCQFQNLEQYRNKLSEELFTYISTLVANAERQLDAEREVDSINKEFTHLNLFQNAHVYQMYSEFKDFSTDHPQEFELKFTVPEGDYYFF